MILKIQVMCQKDEGFDVRGKGAGYGVKIPQVLWGKVKENFGAGSINIEAINGKKSRN